MSLVSIVLLAATHVSCSTSDSDEELEEIIDDVTGDDQQDDGDSGAGTEIKDVTLIVDGVYNTCGFGTDIGIILEGDMERVLTTGVAVSESASNLENDPLSWIHGIVDAPQPVAGPQTLQIKGLRGNRTYYCRPFVRDSEDGILWGEIKQFTTTDEVLFGQETGRGNTSVREGWCKVAVNPYAALNSVYNDVKVNLEDVVLEEFQCSIQYYETVEANAENYGARLYDNEITVNFTNLPPGAKVSFRLCVDCDGLKYDSGERYTVTSRQISESGIVDLSLNVNWSACNLGADFPWGRGDYYTYEEAMQLAEAAPDWQLPTKEDIEQLLSQCEVLPVSFDNLRKGVLVSNDRNTICLPFAESKDADLGDNGFSTGYFWTSTQYFDAAAPLDQSRAYTFRLLGMTSPGDQRYGLVELNKKYAISVRPVYPR